MIDKWITLLEHWLYSPLDATTTLASVLKGRPKNRRKRIHSIGKKKISHSDVLRTSPKQVDTIGSNNTDHSDSSSNDARPFVAASEKPKTSAFVSFSRSFRRTVAKENPELGFGEIAKLVAGKWRSLSESEKQVLFI